MESEAGSIDASEGRAPAVAFGPKQRGQRAPISFSWGNFLRLRETEVEVEVWSRGVGSAASNIDSDTQQDESYLSPTNGSAGTARLTVSAQF